MLIETFKMVTFVLVVFLTCSYYQTAIQSLGKNQNVDFHSVMKLRAHMKAWRV